MSDWLATQPDLGCFTFRRAHNNGWAVENGAGQLIAAFPDLKTLLKEFPKMVGEADE